MYPDGTVLIDECIPRDAAEVTSDLLDYLLAMSTADDKGTEAIANEWNSWSKDDQDTYGYEMVDDITEAITARLDDGLVCILTDGNVIVTTKANAEVM